jgi:SOS-response transcriptional repressor LexA
MKRNFNQIRLRNLEMLIAEAGSATNLARAAGTNSSYLSQVRNQLPTRKGTPRRIGDALAAKLETSMNKPPGWMDDQHEGDLDNTLEYSAHLEPGQDRLHPVIAWGEIGITHTISENVAPPYGTQLLACPVKCSAESFVLQVRGASMEPRFCEGELIFVDPDAVAAHGKYVVVRFEGSNEVAFKQLIVEEGKQYLRALNPDWPHRIMEVDKGTSIYGVVVFKGEVV